MLTMDALPPLKEGEHVLPGLPAIARTGLTKLYEVDSGDDQQPALYDELLRSGHAAQTVVLQL